MVPLNASHSADIDQLVNQICPTAVSVGELRQLQVLFETQFLGGLEKILKSALPHTGSIPAHLEVSLGWIDKIPIAKGGGLPIAGVQGGVELGDAIIRAIDQQILPNGRIKTLSARAVLLQAKLAASDQTAQARVPVGNGGSGRKELALMSSWPVFDLYETAASGSPLMAGITLTLPAERYGWFLAARRSAKQRLPAPPWRSWWMAGRPKDKSPCDVTLGEFLTGFLGGAGLPPHPIGHPYRPNRKPGKTPDWSDLCNAIFGIVGRRQAPPSIFGPGRSRLESFTLRQRLYRDGVSTGGGTADLAWRDGAAQVVEALAGPADHLAAMLEFFVMNPSRLDPSLARAFADEVVDMAARRGPPRGRLPKDLDRGRFAVLTVSLIRPPDRRD